MATVMPCNPHSSTWYKKMLNLLTIKTRIRLRQFVYNKVLLPVAICFTWLVILSVAGCAATPGTKPVREATKLAFDITASPRANPDQQGRYSPIMVTIYELKSPTQFQEMDFFSLQNNGKELLGDDLLNKEEFILQPGETIHIRHKTTPGTTTIGMTAGYRNITHSVWKKVFRLEPAPYEAWYRVFIPANRTEKTIRLETNEVRVLSMQNTALPKKVKKDLSRK